MLWFFRQILKKWVLSWESTSARVSEGLGMEEACGSAESLIYRFILNSTSFSGGWSLKTDGVIWPERLFCPGAGLPLGALNSELALEGLLHQQHNRAQNCCCSQLASPAQSDGCITRDCSK